MQQEAKEVKKVDVNYIKDNINFLDLANYFEEDKVQVSYNSVKFCCPKHEEKTPSFVYDVDKKFFHCFGCSFNGDVVDYIKFKKNCDFINAIKFLLKVLGLEENSFGGNNHPISYKKQLRALGSLDRKKENTFTKFTEKDIQAMKLMRGDWFLDRGFTKETLDYFDVGFDSIYNRVVVPVRNENNELIGATGRTIYKDWADRVDKNGEKLKKWQHYKGTNTSENFFNIYNAIPESRTKKNGIILVEGPADAMWLWQNGFKNVIACMTNRISSVQKGLLLKNFMDIYLFLDGDSGGEVGKSAIFEEIKGYFNIFDVKIPAGKDPDDLDRNKIEEVLENARKI